ncbi:MAG: questin oxidase family protein [Proteobacteria bacterium]|nr:questin oxidase family protein [Pseudomonadota bacterium]
MEVSPALLALLNGGAAHDAEYGDGLSNHAPMALVALERLGADGERLNAWLTRYANAKRLRPARPVQAWPRGDAWPDRLGDRAAWPAYRGLFREWIDEEGARSLLAQALPQLLPGCAAAAFHGLIRTAYAVQVGHLAELADGLAHWASFHLPLGPLPDAASDQPDPLPLLRRLRAGDSEAPLIAGRIADAARGGDVNRAIAPLAIDAATPERLARAAAFAYAESGNFTALHLVTASHAMRVLARFSDEPEAAWRWFWQAWAHGVVAARLRPAAPVPLRPWDALVATARASDDEHVIKLVDSAREEERCYGGDDWRRAASRAVAGAASAAG